MDIETLCHQVYEDLNGEITAVNQLECSNDLEIEFECDDWCQLNQQRHFKIHCHQVVESTIAPTMCYQIEWSDNSPLLLKHNQPQGHLYYSSKPKDRHQILGLLWQAHESVFQGWRPLREHINCYTVDGIVEFANDNYGLLAHGPEPLMKHYQNILTNKLSTNYVPTNGKMANYQALIFEHGFVICQSVTVTDLD